MRAAWLRIRLGACLAACLGACVAVPDFEEPSLVDRPRVLAVVAEPPEVAPGEDVELSLLVGGAETFDATWRVCGTFTGFGGNQYGDGPEDEGCGGPLALSLGEGASATLPGEISATLFADLEVAAAILGAALPEDTIEDIRARVGLPLSVEARVTADGKLIRAVKRVLVREGDTPHTNPPPPHFLFGDVEVRARDGEAFTCEAVSGAPLTAPLDAEIELAPVVEGDAEAWTERFQVLDFRGRLTEREEQPFYSWFATGGDLSQGVTKAPLRNDLWRTPDEPGCHTLWLVVRDGHGGASACQVAVGVGSDCP